MNEIFLPEKQNIFNKRLEKLIDLFNRQPRIFFTGLLKWKINWYFIYEKYVSSQNFDKCL